jgi:hypothetical protein
MKLTIQTLRLKRFHQQSPKTDLEKLRRMTKRLYLKIVIVRAQINLIKGLQIILDTTSMLLISL